MSSSATWPLQGLALDKLVLVKQTSQARLECALICSRHPSDCLADRDLQIQQREPTHFARWHLIKLVNRWLTAKMDDLMHWASTPRSAPEPSMWDGAHRRRQCCLKSLAQVIYGPLLMASGPIMLAY